MLPELTTSHPQSNTDLFSTPWRDRTAIQADTASLPPGVVLASVAVASTPPSALAVADELPTHVKGVCVRGPVST